MLAPPAPTSLHPGNCPAQRPCSPAPTSLHPGGLQPRAQLPGTVPREAAWLGPHLNSTLTTVWPLLHPFVPVPDHALPGKWLLKTKPLSWGLILIMTFHFFSFLSHPSLSRSWYFFINKNDF